MIRFSSLGDVVLQSSFVAWFKSQNRACRLSFLTSHEFSDLVDNNSYVDQLICFDRKRESLTQLYQKVRALNHNHRIDMIVDLHCSSRSKLLRLFLPYAIYTQVNKRSWHRKLLVLAKINFLKKTSSVQIRNVEDFIGVFYPSFSREQLERLQDLDISINLMNKRVLKINDKELLKRKNIIVCPAASFASKRWPISSFKFLIEKLLQTQELVDFKIISLAGPDDDYAKDIQVENPRFVNLSGKTNLQESINYLSECFICVGNDSGMNHIAESYGKPVLTIFGSTHPDFGFRPINMNSTFLYSHESCSPCSTTGSKKCFRDRHFCMENISVDHVYNSVLQIIRESI